jgi:alkyl hydroperoxide reductase subunit AhpF
MTEQNFQQLLKKEYAQKIKKDVQYVVEADDQKCAKELAYWLEKIIKAGRQTLQNYSEFWEFYK